MNKPFAMGRLRLAWQVGLPMALLLGVGLWAQSWQAARLMHSAHSVQVASQLASSAALVAEEMANPLADGDRPTVDALAKRLGLLGSLRVTVIDPSGVVLGESDGDPARMDNHASRPEVAAALAQGSGAAVRHSDTLDVDMMYAAREVRVGDRVVGVVRAGVQLGLLQAADRSLARHSFAAVVVVALCSISLGFLIVRRVTRPLEELESLAKAWASGDVSRPPPAGGSVEVQRVAAAMQHMATVRSDFVANVSHELKTPVTSIKGFLETLLSGALEDSTKARRFVEIASRQADRLGAIIDDLLLLSRVEQDGGHLTMDRGPTPLEPLVRGALDVCRIKADEKGVQFEVRCEPGLSASVNAALAEQAVVNLVDNAVKYSGTGQRPVEVTVSRDGAWAVLSVRDHGAGIDPEHLPRLFERFYRVDKARSRSQGGTGLGLAIVKHIVQAQGGTVEVSSRPGEGSTFTLRFPLA